MGKQEAVGLEQFEFMDHGFLEREAMIENPIPAESLNTEDCPGLLHFIVDGGCLVLPLEIFAPVLLDPNCGGRAFHHILDVDHEGLFVILQQRLHIVLGGLLLECHGLGVVVIDVSDEHLHDLIILALEVVQTVLIFLFEELLQLLVDPVTLATFLLA